jgi:PAS domain S-box-containing protein
MQSSPPPADPDAALIALRAELASLRAQNDALREELRTLRAPAALHDASFFERALAAVPNVVYVWDLKLQRPVYFNDVAGRRLGLSVGEMLAMGGDVFERLAHPEDRSRLQAHFARLATLRDAELAGVEYRLRDRAGRWRWFEAQNTVFSRRADGRAWQVVGTASEVTVRKQAELSLRESASALRTQVDRMPMAVIEFDAQGIVQRWAGEAEHMFGWTEAEALGRPLRELQLVHPDDREGVQQVMARLREGVQHVGWSNRNLTRDGRVLHCSWHNSWRAGEGGAPPTVLSMVLDITGHQRAEDALRASEERHRLLAETMLQGVVHQDADGRIIAMNPAAVRILGKSRERFLGSDSVQEAHDTVREDGSPFPGEEHPSMRALRSGEAVRGVVMGVWNPQTSQRRWLRIDAVPVRSPGQERPGEVYTVFEDITDARRAQEALSLANERFKLALTGSQIVVFQQDLSLRYTWIHNPAPGLTPAQVLGQDDAGICERPEDVQRLHSLKRKVIDSGVGERQEVNLRIRGVDHDYDMRVEPLRDSGRRITGIICVAVDITERKRAERSLREADRQKDLFIATLAHELRNPLAPILNAATALRAKAPADATTTQCSAVIERQVAHMARLLDDLLDVSRVASGRLLLRPEPLLLQAVIDEAVETARPLIDAAGHALSLRLPDDSLRLHGDRIRLTQVIANLLTNAAKYTQARGRIEVLASREGDDVVVRVRDSGIGLASEHLHSVFEMFGQVDAALERSQGGLGIGLALAKGLVEMHGGSIRAFSEGPGRGSEFVVHLPLARDALPRALGVPARPPDAPALPPGRRILVVDDNRDAAETLALLLSVSGHEVQTAHDGVEALAVAAAWNPEVVLLDIGLPRLNGYEVCRTLRQRQGGPGLRVVAVSGWGQEQDRRRSAEAGFDAHLVKPVQHPQLEALLAAPLLRQGQTPAS